MAKEAYINARVDRQIKERAEKVLAHVGISTTDAVTMMLHQIVLRQGLPFDVRVPNCETISAMEGLDAGKGERSTDSTGNVFDKAVRKRNQRWA
jgi:DNA-damage-inducible protein J